MVPNQSHNFSDHLHGLFRGLPDAAQEWWEKWMPILCTYIPGYQNAVRKLLFAISEFEFVTFFSPTEKARANRQAKRQEFVDILNSRVPREYQEILTPDYEIFCKRRVVDVDWYKSLQKDNVSITSQPMTAIGPKTVTLGPGRNYPPLSKTTSEAPTDEKTIPADIIIMANGYETGEWLHPLDVTGRNNQSLYDLWSTRGGAQAYMGTAMDQFPNFFLIFGPNTATGHSSVILASRKHGQLRPTLHRPYPKRRSLHLRSQRIRRAEMDSRHPGRTEKLRLPERRLQELVLQG